MTSHAGWPSDDHLVMDRGRRPSEHADGRPGKHNYLLGGFGNDTIYGGDSGDVIWGDYRPSGYPSSQTAEIHAGNGKNFIYANDTVNTVFTGTDPEKVVHAHSGSGTITCKTRTSSSSRATTRCRTTSCRLQADQLLLGRLLTARRDRAPQMLTWRMIDSG